MIDVDALPSPAGRRIAVRVTKDAQRQLRGGHPWIFDRSITSTSHDGASGDLAVVFDDRRDFAAIGLWDPDSPIRLRVLHAGSPLTIDDTFFHERISAAVEHRRPLLDSPDHDAYRLVHGENDGLPGLVVDRYADVAVVKLYTDAWVPHLRAVLGALQDVLAPASTVLRLARLVAPRPDLGLVDGATLTGPTPREPVMFLENGLTLEAHPTTGQKTGHFLDQRDNRARVRELAEGADVLDVFSCTGGFSVHAAVGGARSVHSVDLARPALAAVVRNMGHNADRAEVAACRHRTTAGDAFAVMADLAATGTRFHMVIVDPPSFASRQSGVAAALAAYRRLTGLALDLIVPGGTLVQASCSSRVGADEFLTAVHGVAVERRTPFTEIERTAHALDHPIGFPEGAYLKAVFATIG